MSVKHFAQHPRLHHHLIRQRSWRYVVLVGLAMGVMSLLTACGGQDDADVPTPTPVPDIAAPADDAADLTDPVDIATPSLAREATGNATPGVIVDGSPVANGTPVEASLVAPQPTAVVINGTVIGAVVWTTAIHPESSAPLERRTSISYTVPTIYAAVPLLRADAGTVISAEWRFEDDPIDGVTSAVTMTSDVEGVWIIFRLDRSDERVWPDGGYSISVRVDEREVEQATIQVLSTR